MSNIPAPTPEDAAHIAKQQADYAAEQAAENARAEAVGNDYPTTINTGSYEDVGTATVYDTVVYGYDTIEEANAAQAEAASQGLWTGPVEPYGTGGGAVRLQVPGSATKPASDNSQ